MTTGLKEAIELYQSQMEMVNTLWSFFGTVTLAVIGFTIGSEKATHSLTEVVVIVLGYSLFALIGNLTALLDAYEILRQLSALVSEHAKNAPKLSQAFDVRDRSQIVLYHVGTVVVACIAIVAYYYRKRR